MRFSTKKEKRAFRMGLAAGAKRKKTSSAKRKKTALARGTKSKTSGFADQKARERYFRVMREDYPKDFLDDDFLDAIEDFARK